jgi:DnaJ-class molecular chaperone
MTLPDDQGLSADIAAETARMVVQLRNEIAPTPTPPSDGKCKLCNGTGKMPTDGRIVITCSVCGGSGKEPKAAAPCKDGKCR